MNLTGRTLYDKGDRGCTWETWPVEIVDIIKSPPMAVSASFRFNALHPAEDDWYRALLESHHILGTEQ